MSAVQCKYAKSLGGGFDGTPASAWGTVDYTDRYKPTVFFGMYDLRDYIALWRHRGKAWVLWAGSDIQNLINGFTFNDGKLKWLSKLLRGNWWVLPVLKKADHWCENIQEYIDLSTVGINASICPSYLGEVGKPISYRWQDKPAVYLCASEDRQEEYGFGIVERIAPKVPQVTFHLYGALWQTKWPNVVIHGRVSRETMEREIKDMQCGLRLNEKDGFSEITAKSVLWGQWPITRIPYPMIDYCNSDQGLIGLLNGLSDKKEPNYEAREYYQLELNRYPWNAKLLH